MKGEGKMGHHCRPNLLSPVQNIVYPTKHCVKNNFIPHQVNHIHPTHTTIHNHHMVKHNHFYPHTQSVVDSVSNQHVNMGPGSPQMVSPASMNPMGNKWC
jgi:spore coat protein D